MSQFHLCRLTDKAALFSLSDMEDLLQQLSSTNTRPKLNPEDVKKALACELSYIAGVFLNLKLVGMGVIHLKYEVVGTSGHIKKVIVMREYRGRHLFTRIMNALEDFARTHGAYKVELTSDNDRQVAHAMYKARGYKPRNSTLFSLELPYEHS